jgi:hypothetical protein
MINPRIACATRRAMYQGLIKNLAVEVEKLIFGALRRRYVIIEHLTEELHKAGDAFAHLQ